MNIIRWDPWDDLATLRHEMNKMIEGITTRRTSPKLGPEAVWSPAIDLYETDAEVVVKVLLPGMKKEDIDITVADDLLTIKGESKQETETKKRNYYYREMAWGQFIRSIPLPAGLKPEDASAEFQDGILQVHVPKSEEVKPKVHKLELK